MKKKTCKETAILEASTELFLEHGFRDVSISNIIEKANCSRETVYRYFSNKEDIFTKIIEGLMDNYLSAMEHAIAVETDDLREGLISWSLALLRATTDENYIRFRRLVVSEVASRPEHGKLYFEMTYKQGTKAVANYLKVFETKGALKDIDPERLAGHFVGMMLYELMHLRVLGVKKAPSKTQIAKHVETTVDDFLLGFAN